MKVREFLEIMNYHKFKICVEDPQKGIVEKINIDETKIRHRFLNNEVLDLDINMIQPEYDDDDEYIENFYIIVNDYEKILD